MKKQLVILYLLLFIVFLSGAGTVIFLLQDMDVSEETINLEEEIYDYDEVRDMVVIPAATPKPSVVPAEEGSKVEIYIPEIEMDIDNLLLTNSHFNGWFLIPDIPISYPVVLGNDNSFYLNHTLYGTSSAFGCLFFDTTSVEGSKNRVIHGHNMGLNRDEMFSLLINYQNQTYAEENKYIFFAGLDGITDAYEVFAVVNFDTNHIDEFDYRTATFEGEGEYNNFISYLQKQSVYTTEYTPSGEETLILSTCNRQYGASNRLLICAGKVSSSS